MKKIIVLVLLIFCLSAFIGCSEFNQKTSDDDIHADASVSLDINQYYGGPWAASAYSPTSEFDIDDVTIRFGIWGKFSEAALSEKEYNIFSDIKLQFVTSQQSYVFDIIDAVDKDGNAVVLDRKDLVGYDNKENQYYIELTIPTKVFQFNKGEIAFQGLAELKQEGEYNRLWYSKFAYRKINENKVICCDLNDQEEDDEPIKGIHDGFSPLKDKTITDYCAFIAQKGSPYNDEVFIDYYFGSVFDDDREFEYADLYFVTGCKGDGEKRFIKRIENYSKEEYSVDRLLDYYGNLVSISFRHKETIKVPQSLMTKASDNIYLFVYGKEKGQDKEKLLSFIPFRYDYMFPESFSNKRPYNRVSLNAATSYGRDEYYDIVERNK